MIIYGGTYYGCNETYTLDLNTLDWEQLSVTGDLPPETQQQAAVLDSSNKNLIVFGGMIYTREQEDTLEPPVYESEINIINTIDQFYSRPNIYSNDTYVLNLATNTWLQKEPVNPIPSARSHLAYGYSSRLQKMVIFGGYDGMRLNDTWFYNLQSNEWEFITPTTSLPSDRNSSTIISIDNPSYSYLALFGGYDGSSYLNDLWKFEYYKFNQIADEEININVELGNYPNPFNPTTTIKFSLVEDSNLELSIYNAKGKKVKQFLSDQLSAGQHSIIWNGDDEMGNPVSSGVYFYKLIMNGKIESVKKCLLLK